MKLLIKNNALLPLLVTLFGTILMAVTVFLPYSTAIDERAEFIKNMPDAVIYEDLDMTASDLYNVSMIEYAKVYSGLSEQLLGNSLYGVIYVIFVSLIGGLSLISLLFALVRKPIAVVVFNLMAFAVFLMQNWDYTDRGVIPSSSYGWGIGYYIFFFGTVIAIIGAILMLIAKIKSKEIEKE